MYLLSYAEMKTDARNSLTDEEIIRNILEDNHTEYYDILYKRYFSRVRDKCYSIVKNRNTAEELADDILCNAYEKLASFKRASSFSSWLYSIKYNHCIDYLRN